MGHLQYLATPERFAYLCADLQDLVAMTKKWTDMEEGEAADAAGVAAGKDGETEILPEEKRCERSSREDEGIEADLSRLMDDTEFDLVEKVEDIINAPLGTCVDEQVEVVSVIKCSCAECQRSEAVVETEMISLMSEDEATPQTPVRAGPSKKVSTEEDSDDSSEAARQAPPENPARGGQKVEKEPTKESAKRRSRKTSEEMPELRSTAFQELTPRSRMRQVKSATAAASRRRLRVNTKSQPAKAKAPSPVVESMKRPAAAQVEAKDGPALKRPASQVHTLTRATPRPTSIQIANPVHVDKDPDPNPSSSSTGDDTLKGPFTTTYRNEATDKRSRGEAYVLQAPGSNPRRATRIVIDFGLQMFSKS